MAWDNRVNKNGIIYAVVTTFGVRNMPSIKQDCVFNSENPFELHIINFCIQNDIAI